MSSSLREINSSIEEFREIRNKKKNISVKKWHASLRERLIQTGQINAQYGQKRGYFKQSQQYNVDQSPLPFSYECRKTYESPETDKNVWVSQSNTNSG